ncbi:hypothetical protein HCJ76_17685 [Streptomyces sp. MC1]|uniref:hypothetical protein n=1 Tax=Streptomyces sp. MC1 TaxID=295105 RepID=UPI0018CB2FE3|nr:hypothetical protein [Streptomyces sp. MC1]MBG7699870.1 hypothetical protein [Streptomyces sp. MC1]
MPADEVTRGTDVDGSRARTGPRHAAPRKPLFTRFHMPAGKAIASVAMPTAVLMGMGFTSTLALADNNGSPSPSTSAKSLTADEYKDCVKALDDGTKDPSASPSPSASQSTPASPSPSETTGSGKTQESGGTSSSDSGSDDKDTPEPTATSGSSDSGSDSGSGSSDSGSAGSGSGSDTGSGSSSGGDTTTPTQTQSGGNVLDTIGDTLGDLLTGGDKDSGTSSQTPAPTPSASQSSAADTTDTSSKDTSSGGGEESGGTSDTVKDTVKKATDTVKDTVEGTTGTVSKTAGDATKAAGDATASATPSPSASESASADDCPVATDDEGGVDNKVPVADDPWYLNASSLLLKGANYQGIVEVKTANGTTKKVLKYVISGGTDIGDLHQTVKDKQANKTYHVQAAKGSTSTITGGDTVMYTESISGNLFGLIPVTFSPDSPPPLNIPLIYFTNVKVVQAAQFGGNLHVPGMHVYTTD